MSERDEGRIQELRDRVIKFGRFELPENPVSKIARLRAELIKAQQARDFINENWIKEKAALDEICSQRDRLRDELAAKDARIAEFDIYYADLYADLQEWKGSTERAEARVAELEGAIEINKVGVKNLRARAELTSPAGPDGKSLAVLYCLERAEADVKILREALEGMIAVAEGRFDGNPHADIDAIAKARAAQYTTDQ